jgi:hypothetical protein
MTRYMRGLSSGERALLDELDASRQAFAAHTKGLEAKLRASDDAVRLAHAACDEALRVQSDIRWTRASGVHARYPSYQDHDLGTRPETCPLCEAFAP